MGGGAQKWHCWALHLHRLGLDTGLAFGQALRAQTWPSAKPQRHRLLRAWPSAKPLGQGTNLAPGQALRARNRLSPCPCVPLHHEGLPHVGGRLGGPYLPRLGAEKISAPLQHRRHQQQQHNSSALARASLGVYVDDNAPLGRIDTPLYAALCANLNVPALQGNTVLGQCGQTNKIHIKMSTGHLIPITWTS